MGVSISLMVGSGTAAELTGLDRLASVVSGILSSAHAPKRKLAYTLVLCLAWAKV